MLFHFLKRFVLVMSMLTFICCGSLPDIEVFPPKREFRAIWIASVVNIDWPKNGHDAVEKQQKDFITLLDFYRKLHFNAVIVQIRTAGDAFYPSEKAPWSRFLTGKEGQAPKPYYDPLQWMIEAAHDRGFEFHAWLNPYRATFDLNTEVLSANHDYFKHPEWIVKYGKKYYYNPGLPEVRSHLLSILTEVNRNYDIDAIHFDDYFYPYKIKGESFDDMEAYARYGKQDQKIDDWRRENVHLLIEAIHDSIKTQKPWVQFGISPFGIWRNADKDPRGSDTQAGQTTYDDLYADPLLWMEKGWIDYIVPQLYWSMEHPKVSHRKLVGWWAKMVENTNLYIGNGVYKIGKDSDTAWSQKDQLVKQLLLARNTTRVKGNVFFSAKSLQHQNNRHLVNHLSETIYRYKVLPPALWNAPELPMRRPKLLSIEKGKEGSFRVVLDKNRNMKIRYAVVYAYDGSKKKAIKNPEHIIDLFYVRLKNDNIIDMYMKSEQFRTKKHFAITYVDVYGQESEPLFFKIPDKLISVKDEITF